MGLGSEMSQFSTKEPYFSGRGTYCWGGVGRGGGGGERGEGWWAVGLVGGGGGGDLAPRRDYR